MEKENKRNKILPYFSSKEDLPISYKVNRRIGVNEKIHIYKMSANERKLKDENVYNPYINELFKTSIKIRKK